MSVATLNNVAADGISLAVAVVWQSTLLALVVAIVARLLRRSSPSVRYWSWQIVAFKLLLAPLWTAALPLAWLPYASIFDRSHAESQHGIAAVAPYDVPLAPDEIATAPAADPSRDASRHAPAARRRPDARPTATWSALSWQSWLLLAWGAAVVGQIALVALQGRRLARLLRRASPASDALERLVAQCAARIGLKRVPPVLVTPLECSPFVCRLWRPVMVLPRSLEAILSEQDLAPVVVHELAHIRRRDLLWGWVPQLARMLYFFHPVAHYVAFRIRLEAELAADAAAMASGPHGARAYADLLVRVVSRLSEPAMLRGGSTAAAGFDGQSFLAGKE